MLVLAEHGGNIAEQSFVMGRHHLSLVSLAQAAVLLEIENWVPFVGDSTAASSFCRGLLQTVVLLENADLLETAVETADLLKFGNRTHVVVDPAAAQIRCNLLQMADRQIAGLLEMDGLLQMAELLRAVVPLENFGLPEIVAETADLMKIENQNHVAVD